MNTILAGWWIFSIILQLPYLQYNTTAERISNETVLCLATSTCLSSPGSFIMKFTTYTSISLDLIFIFLVIVLNGFIIDLLWRQKRKVRAASTTGNTWNKDTAQAVKILLSLDVTSQNPLWVLQLSTQKSMSALRDFFRHLK